MEGRRKKRTTRKLGRDGMATKRQGSEPFNRRTVEWLNRWNWGWGQIEYEWEYERRVLAALLRNRIAMEGRPVLRNRIAMPILRIEIPTEGGEDGHRTQRNNREKCSVETNHKIAIGELHS